MQTSVRNVVWAAAMATALLAGSAALAASAAAPASITVQNTPLGLTNTRGLDFGTVVPTGNLVTVPVFPPSYRPGGPTRGATDATAGGSNTALFSLTGTPTREITVSLPTDVQLSAGGATTLTVTQIVVGDTAGRFTAVNGSDDHAWSAAIPDSGTLPFELGGLLEVDGYPPAGAYSGTVSISVDYN